MISWNPTVAQIKGVVRTTLVVLLFATGFYAGKVHTENHYIKVDLSRSSKVIKDLEALGEASAQQASKEQTIYVQSQPIIERIITSPSNCSDDDFRMFNNLINSEQLSTINEVPSAEGD